AAYAIGPALRLAQVHVDAGAEAAAEGFVGGIEVHQIVGSLFLENPAGEDDRLRRSGPVDQHDALLRYGYRYAEILDRLDRIAPAPVAETLLQHRHELGQRRVAHDDDPGSFRPQPGLVEIDQVLAGEILHDLRLAGSAGRDTVGMGFAVEQRRERPLADGSGIVEFALDAVQLLRTHALQLRRVE